MTDDKLLTQHGTGGLAGPDPPAAPATRSAEVELLSLAPLYEETHHASYLARLAKAITDPRNRNIALTGRYGAGKSSVLDEFQNTQKAHLVVALVRARAQRQNDRVPTQRRPAIDGSDKTAALR